jgi:hypothetical protein
MVIFPTQEYKFSITTFLYFSRIVCHLSFTYLNNKKNVQNLAKQGSNQYVAIFLCFSGSTNVTFISIKNKSKILGVGTGTTGELTAASLPFRDNCRSEAY